MSRVWRIWTNAFSAAVGDIAIAPHHDLIRICLTDHRWCSGYTYSESRPIGQSRLIRPGTPRKTGDVCKLFQKAAETSSPALRALVSIMVLVIRGQLTSYFRQRRLLTLRQKARQVCQSNLEDRPVTTMAALQRTCSFGRTNRTSHARGGS